jgi:hypothetical protein
MEVKSISKIPISPQLKEKMERDQKQKEEATKSFGDYLISLTNKCFDKCIDTDSIYISINEEKCVDAYFDKYYESHLYALNKFNEINNMTEVNTFERAKDFGDYYGFLEDVYREDLDSLRNKKF